MIEVKIMTTLYVLEVFLLLNKRTPEKNPD